jgi:hypothetical protein
MDESNLAPPPEWQGHLYYPDDQNHKVKRLDDDNHDCSPLHFEDPFGWHLGNASQ